MTREEAKGYLTDLKHWKFVPDNLADEAIDMAIKALEQEPVLDKIRAEIKQLPYQRIFGKVSSYSLLDAVVEIIDKYKAESEKE